MDGRDKSRSPRGVSGGDDEIYSLIFERERARLSKDWPTADTLRERLSQLGVELFDKTNSWKAADGRAGRIPSWTEIEMGASPETLMTMGPMGPEPAVGGSLSTYPGNSGGNQIKHLVQMREQARASKDFAQSDRLRDELKAMGVDLFDKEKMWRSSDGQSGVIIGYRGTGPPTDVEVSTLVVQREKARQSGDYGTSDMIRDELKSWGVDILDKEKMWRSKDGRSGAVPTWSTIAGGDPVHQGAIGPVNYGGGGQGAYGVNQDLKAQVVQAALAAASTPAMAAKTLQMLQSLAAGGGGGGMNHIGGGGGQFARVGPVVTPPAVKQNNMAAAKKQQSKSPEAQEAISFISQCQVQGRSATDSEIEWLVSVREKMRQNKDYTAADEMRNALRSGLGVELHEKQKMWICADGRQGMIPLWGAAGV